MYIKELEELLGKLENAYLIKKAMTNQYLVTLFIWLRFLGV